jgi:DNA-binding transcriptional LysR family regulator
MAALEPSLSVEQLRSFQATARNLSFSKAAADLHVTQPCVSKHIRGLEEILDVTLFHRSGRRVELTEAGDTFLRHVQMAFQSLERGVEALALLRGLQAGHLSIGAASTIGIYMLPQILGTFKQRFPGIEVTLQISNKAETLRRLLNGEIDLGFVGPPVKPKELEKKPYLVDELVLVMAPSHRLAGAESVPAKELQEEVFILRERGSGTREIMEEELTKAGIEIRKFMELGSTEAIKQAVAANLGVSIISRFAIALEAITGRLRSAHIPDLRLHRQLYVVFRRERFLSWTALEFLRFVEQATLSDGEPSRPVSGRQRGRAPSAAVVRRPATTFAQGERGAR